MVVWLAWNQVYKVGPSRFPKRSFSDEVGMKLWQTQSMEKFNRTESRPILHTSLKLRMQNSKAADKRLLRP
jgi:hypothetical protein